MRVGRYLQYNIIANDAATAAPKVEDIIIRMTRNNKQAKRESGNSVLYITQCSDYECD